jgi:hypothetical protein
MVIRHWAVLLGALTVAACGGRGDKPEATGDTGGMMGHMDSGARGMGNMQGMPMMSNMRAHMDSMMRMSPQEMQARMAAHEQMMSRMMDGMGADMRGMNMSGMPDWNALTDSVKRDLADLPNLKGQELSSRMRSHAERVKRLIAMHEQMMRK